ncbi:hypothetical protein CK203_082359 [Vitis vinifera]|uniref:Uncharacterized protein n=1 Tax=Vitis vinifera TaxID=29760 RepID=A0A438DSN5_VITVI|nr:hypothetical protein CK203_082359 [Vitis vinifera]
MTLEVNADVDEARLAIDRRSTSSYCTFLRGNLGRKTRGLEQPQRLWRFSIHDCGCEGVQETVTLTRLKVDSVREQKQVDTCKSVDTVKLFQIESIDIKDNIVLQKLLHLDVLILQKVAGECATIVEKKLKQQLPVLQKSRKNHASFVGALSIVGIIANRFCSPQFIVIMGWDAKDCRLEKAIRWGLGCGVGWGVQPAYLLYVQDETNAIGMWCGWEEGGVGH